MRTMRLPALLLAALAAGLLPMAAEEWATTSFFSPADVGDMGTRKFQVPKGWSVSKYGKGKYRFDGPDSRGQLNCIFYTFESADEATQTADLTTWAPSTALIQDQKAIVREALYPNPFMETPAPASAMLKVRLTAMDGEIADKLQETAQAILNKNALPGLKF